MSSREIATLRKCPTGIKGLDEITGGGLPLGRPTLVCGGTGCGKTLLAMEFLIRGVTEYGEPGVFVSFEEAPSELNENFASLGFDLAGLEKSGKLVIDHLYIERAEVEETGEYDLEGLFIRLGMALDSICARRIVLDTIEALFSGFDNENILRAELRRLFRWLKDKGVTAVITGEQGEKTLTRHGLEEYVADCVIFLNHRTEEQIATRRLRIVKYRGTSHGTNEYPFLLDEQGISILPITSMGLDHPVSDGRVSSGVPRLDAMLGGEGYFRGSSILVSGTPGTGKTSVSNSFVDAACRRGERCLYFAFEESQSQIIRNMNSVGLDLQQWVTAGLLKFQPARPTQCGLEMHLVAMHKHVEEFRPDIVIIDPISNLIGTASRPEVEGMLCRLIDYLKMRQITLLCTDLTTAGVVLETTQAGISSLMDTWLLLKVMEGNGERNRGLYILKSRGMNHSNQIREFLITSNGLQLRDVYVGTGEFLTGTARIAQEAREMEEALERTREVERRQREIERKRKEVEAQIAALRAAFEEEHAELERLVAADRSNRQKLSLETQETARLRHADTRSEQAGAIPPGGQ